MEFANTDQQGQERQRTQVLQDIADGLRKIAKSVSEMQKDPKRGCLKELPPSSRRPGSSRAARGLARRSGRPGRCADEPARQSTPAPCHRSHAAKFALKFVEDVDRTGFCAGELHRLSDDGGEHGLKIERRVHRLGHFSEGAQISDRAAKLISALAQLVQQARIFYGDDGSRGEVRDQRDLLVGKGSRPCRRKAWTGPSSTLPRLATGTYQRQERVSNR